MSAVVDASVLIASFAVNEAHHAVAFRLLRKVIPEHLGLVVPATFVVEVAAGLARKVAAHTIEPDEAERGLRYARSVRFRQVAVDEALADRAAAVAWKARLRGYDAVYAALALAYRLPLLTFDTELVKRCLAEVPGMRICDAYSSPDEVEVMLR